MAAPVITAAHCFLRKTKEEEEHVEKIYRRYKEVMIPSLPRQKGILYEHSYLYQGFWFDESTMAGIMYLQEHFKPRPTDILLATAPKCGTTWLKGLIFSIMNRETYPNMEEHPLLTNSVHDCVPFLEAHLFREPLIGDPDILPSPRLLCTHAAYTMLPKLAMGPDGCRIVYVWRNPKDTLVSLWHYVCSRRRKLRFPELSLGEVFELFSQGTCPNGPFWDQVLGYWKASLEYPNKVLVLKYDDMKKDTVSHVKRLAEFLGKPFAAEEEERGAIEEIVELCSFERLRKLAKVPERGSFHEGSGPDYGYFFGKGEVGDWKHALTPDMARRLDEITEEMFKGTGLEV